MSPLWKVVVDRGMLNIRSWQAAVLAVSRHSSSRGGRCGSIAKVSSCESSMFRGSAGLVPSGGSDERSSWYQSSYS